MPGFQMNAQRLANMPKEQMEQLRMMMQQRLGYSNLPLPVDANGRPIMPPPGTTITTTGVPPTTTTGVVGAGMGGGMEQQFVQMDVFSATKLGLFIVVKKKVEDAFAEGKGEEMVRQRGE